MTLKNVFKISNEEDEEFGWNRRTIRIKKKEKEGEDRRNREIVRISVNEGNI